MDSGIAKLVEHLIAARRQGDIGHLITQVRVLDDKSRQEALSLAWRRMQETQGQDQEEALDVGRMIVGDAPTSFLNEVLIAPFPDDLKIHACWLLEGWGDASSLLALQQLLHSPVGPSVKQAALLPLAMIKDVSVDDVLLEATLDDDEAVTELARELLEERRR